MQQSDVCHDCGRPNATAEHNGDEDGICFLAQHPKAEWAQLACWEVAVPRLRLMQASAQANLHTLAEARAKDYRRHLRDTYAGIALQGILADAKNWGVEHASAEARYHVCRAAAQYASGLLAALDYEAGDR